MQEHFQELNSLFRDFRFIPQRVMYSEKVLYLSEDSEYVYPDKELRILEHRQRPKDQNYIRETVGKFSEAKFIKYFRLSERGCSNY